MHDYCTFLNQFNYSSNIDNTFIFQYAILFMEKNYAIFSTVSNASVTCNRILPNYFN